MFLINIKRGEKLLTVHITDEDGGIIYNGMRLANIQSFLRGVGRKKETAIIFWGVSVQKLTGPAK